MIRPFAQSALVLALALGAWGCGGTKDFVFDAGTIGTPVDAGPCDVYAQTGCPSGQKCTMRSDGTPLCGSAGSGAAYSACTSDAQCVAGTACVTLTFTGYVQGQDCFPFCKLSIQPTDGGTTCKPAASTSCLALPGITEGFCDERAASAGG